MSAEPQSRGSSVPTLYGFPVGVRAAENEAVIERDGPKVLVAIEALAPCETEQVVSRLVDEHGAWPAYWQALILHYSSEGRVSVERSAGQDEHSEEMAPEPTHYGDYNLTDAGDAARLRDAYGKDVRFVKPWDQYMVFDGLRWKPDVRSTVQRRVVDIGKTYQAEGAALIVENPMDENLRDRGADLMRHGLSLERNARVRAVLDLAHGYVPATPEEFDTEPWLLNCANGVVDLRTGRLHPPTRVPMHTQVAGVPYIEGARSETFETFLAEVLPDDDVRRFVQKMMGYTAIGKVLLNVLLIVYGHGSNGKSTLMDICRYVLGGYGTVANERLLVVTKGDEHPTEIARLFGKRLAIANETGEDARLNEARVKWMTSGEPHSGRKMRQDYFEFTPSHTFWMTTNHKPEVRGRDHGIWRRLVPVPFEVLIPDERQDERLWDKLRDDAPAVLAWIVEGALLWQREDGGKLVLPERVRQARAEYRNQMDPLGEWWNESVVLDRYAKTLLQDLYDSYTEWAFRAGEKEVLSREQFADRLDARGGFEAKRTAKGYARVGVKLKRMTSKQEMEMLLDSWNGAPN